jgi:hypothetical protein
VDGTCPPGSPSTQTVTEKPTSPQIVTREAGGSAGANLVTRTNRTSPTDRRAPWWPRRRDSFEARVGRFDCSLADLRPHTLDAIASYQERRRGDDGIRAVPVFPGARPPTDDTTVQTPLQRPKVVSAPDGASTPAGQSGRRGRVGPALLRPCVWRPRPCCRACYVMGTRGTWWTALALVPDILDHTAHGVALEERLDLRHGARRCGARPERPRPGDP